jgi:hypothetical protein
MTLPPPIGIIALALMLSGPLAPAVRSVATSQVLPPPPTLYVDPGASCGRWWPLAVDQGWPEDQLPKLDAVMWCESRCEPRAYNRSGASGLMQVLKSWAPDRDLFDPATNLAVALDVWHRQGWRAWSCH